MFYEKCAILLGPALPRASRDPRQEHQPQRSRCCGRRRHQTSSSFSVFDETAQRRRELGDASADVPECPDRERDLDLDRADGRLMSGEIIYTYPIYRAVQHGFVKYVKGPVRNPASLRYVRREDGARSRSALRKCVVSVMITAS